MPQKIPKEILDSLLNQLSSIDARDNYMMQLVGNGTKIPKEYLKEIAYHIELKSPEKAAEFYLKADDIKNAVRLYLKIGNLEKAAELIESSRLYSKEDRYHFYEQHGQFGKALAFALEGEEEKDKKRVEFYKSLMQYIRR